MPNEITTGMVGYAHAMTDAADQELSRMTAEADRAFAAAEADGWQTWDLEVQADDARHSVDLAAKDHENAAYSQWLMEYRPEDAIGNTPRPDCDAEPQALDGSPLPVAPEPEADG